MGANLSSVKDSRTSVANATAIPAYNNKPSSANNWFALPENSRTPAPAPAPACAPYPSNFNHNIPEYRPAQRKAAAANGKGVITFHSAARWKEYFEASKLSNKLIVIYFTATWCGPCKYMEPTINELAANYNEVEIVKIDVDELFNVSREFKVQVMPTFLFMKKGKEIDKIVGAKKEEVQRKIEKHRI